MRGWVMVKVVDISIDYFIMLSNRLQSTCGLLFQSQFGFATKNLKQIKIRMKAVESIKKITKVRSASYRP